MNSLSKTKRQIITLEYDSLFRVPFEGNWKETIPPSSPKEFVTLENLSVNAGQSLFFKYCTKAKITCQISLKLKYMQQINTLDTETNNYQKYLRLYYSNILHIKVALASFAFNGIS